MIPSANPAAHPSYYHNPPINHHNSLSTAPRPVVTNPLSQQFDPTKTQILPYSGYDVNTTAQTASPSFGGKYPNIYTMQQSPTYQHQNVRKPDLLTSNSIPEVTQNHQVQNDVLNKSLSQSESNTLKSAVGNNHMIDKILGENTQNEGEGANSRKRREPEEISPS